MQETEAHSHHLEKIQGGVVTAKLLTHRERLDCICKDW